jgi:hypothetical protein
MGLNNLYRALSRPLKLVHHIRKLGPKAAVEIFLMLARLKKDTQVKLPQMKHQITIRPGTTDIDMFEEIFFAIVTV